MAIEAPPWAEGTWPGIIVERHTVCRCELFSVTIRPRRRRKARTDRDWFIDQDAAVAFALQAADRRGLPMFDLRGGEVDE